MKKFIFSVVLAFCFAGCQNGNDRARAQVEANLAKVGAAALLAEVDAHPLFERDELEFFYDPAMWTPLVREMETKKVFAGAYGVRLVTHPWVSHNSGLFILRSEFTEPPEELNTTYEKLAPRLYFVLD